VKVRTTHTPRRLVPVQHRRCFLSSCRSQVSKRRQTARGVPEVVEQRVRNAYLIRILVEGAVRATFLGSENPTATAFSEDRTRTCGSIGNGRVVIAQRVGGNYGSRSLDGTRVEIVVDGADVAIHFSSDGGASPCGHVSVGTVLEWVL